MAKFLTIGEGMLELRNEPDGGKAFSYAGDTLNAAIYAKRFKDDMDVYWLSAVGKDQFSEEILSFAANEKINTEFVFTSEEKALGIYSIYTDNQGERFFNYWRNDSAAKQMVALLDNCDRLKDVESFDFVLFTGISLAILNEQDKARLLLFIEQLKAQGTRVVFDPNYRARMWQSDLHAIQWFSKAFSLSDIVLPGLDEMDHLYGTKTHQAVNSMFKLYAIEELVIKCGKDGVVGYFHHEPVCHIPFNPAPIQIDSTAAGDSFAGTYIAARSHGSAINESILSADSVARTVVQYQGAIIDSISYKKAHLENQSLRSR